MRFVRDQIKNAESESELIMGTKIDPGGDGVACPICWGTTSDPFGDDLPPKIMQVTFTGVQKGTGWHAGLPEPPDGVYSGEEDGACVWFTRGDRGFFLKYSSGRSELRFFDDPAFQLFLAIPLEKCISDFVNQITNPAAEWFGGEAHVFV